MEEEPYHNRVLDVVISWIDRNLYKLATIALAVGSYLGMNEAAEGEASLSLLYRVFSGYLASRD